jgi:carbon monoxide dehydrogenase subunit G
VKVQIEKSIPVAAGADTAWELLRDLEAVAACMPGAKITERLDATHFKGTVGVRFGPASMSFRGELELAEVVPAERRLRLTGKGTDSTGSSGASLDLQARVEEADGGTSRLMGMSEVSVSGKAAAFGGRMMSSVADQVLAQFAANFAAKAASMAGAGPGDSSRGGQPSFAAAPGGVAGAAGTAAPAAASEGDPAGAAGGIGGTSGELNGVALLWGVLKSWLRGLFAKKAA